MLELSGPEKYSEIWGKESGQLDANDVYEKLAALAPPGNTIEFGCGVGNGTAHLSRERKVLSFDNNKGLIAEARSRLSDAGIKHQIHECDFFNLSDQDKKLISDFKPKVISGWFIGSHGEDILKRTEEEPQPIVKSKLYREKIEDIIISNYVCVDTVDYIHLVSRGSLAEEYTEKDFLEAEKDDYDTYVFNQIGFEVVDVKCIEWAREGSEFLYGLVTNPNIAKGKSVPMITSLIAKRI